MCPDRLWYRASQTPIVSLKTRESFTVPELCPIPRSYAHSEQLLSRMKFASPCCANRNHKSFKYRHHANTIATKHLRPFTNVAQAVHHAHSHAELRSILVAIHVIRVEVVAHAHRVVRVVHAVHHHVVHVVLRVDLVVHVARAVHAVHAVHVVLAVHHVALHVDLAVHVGHAVRVDHATPTVDRSAHRVVLWVLCVDHALSLAHVADKKADVDRVIRVEVVVPVVHHVDPVDHAVLLVIHVHRVGHVESHRMWRAINFVVMDHVGVQSQIKHIYHISINSFQLFIIIYKLKFCSQILVKYCSNL